MSGHFKRPVVSETYLNLVTYCAQCPSVCPSSQTPSIYLLQPLICPHPGSCYDPADGAVVTTGSPRRSRTR